MEGSREFRAVLGGEVRVSEDAGKHLFAARICNYNVEDDHGTTWSPKTFEASFRGKLPVAVWSHDWRRPFGKVIEHRDSDSGMDIVGEFGDFDAIPDSRMVHALLQSGIINEFSFGFVRTDGSKPNQRGRIKSAQMDEISPVVSGSIPGTKTLAVRSSQDVARATADDLLERVSHGEITAAEALEELSQTRQAPLLEIRSADYDTLALAKETFSDYEFEDVTENDVVVGVRAMERKVVETRVSEPDLEISAAMSKLDSLIKGR